jgi:catechol 2,3-dioxygenase-like lactoylglutathione lyase family enzyme
MEAERTSSMILDHIGLAVRDFARSGSFFRRALAPLNIHTVLEGEGWAMLGRDGKPRTELFMDDGQHLNSDGYALWAELVKRQL